MTSAPDIDAVVQSTREIPEEKVKCQIGVANTTLMLPAVERLLAERMTVGVDELIDAPGQQCLLVYSNSIVQTAMALFELYLTDPTLNVRINGWLSGRNIENRALETLADRWTAGRPTGDVVDIMQWLEKHDG